VALGDSISYGGNASGLREINAKPQLPPYPNLVAMGLEGAFGSKVALKNLSVGGTGIDWGLKMAPAVLKENPDLVIIAFGMNDCGMPRAEWANKIKRLVDAIRGGSENAEIILVSPFIGNLEWEKLNEAAFQNFAKTQAALAGPGLAHADVRAVWSELTKRKRFWEMTGNGLNHPNDFGHRVYAQVILALFSKRVPGF
jgi:acyl-CoA thioesterase I